MTQAEYISPFLSVLAGAKGSTLSRPQSTLLGVSLGKLVTHMEENGNFFLLKASLDCYIIKSEGKFSCCKKET